MVFTMWGLEVDIIGGDIDLGTACVRYEDGSFRNKFITELRADNGFNEIEEAIHQANQQQKQDVSTFKNVE